MMRPIKFRAWDKSNTLNHLNEPDFFEYDIQDGDGEYKQSFGDYLDEDAADVYDIEQYTGMKDKHGKEIYEGDIVHRQGDFYKSDITGKVIFIDGVYRAVGIDKTNLIPHTFEPERVAADLAYLNQQELEILGNIHENPELLEQS